MRGAQLDYLNSSLWSGKSVLATVAFFLFKALAAARDEDRLRQFLISRRSISLPLLCLQFSPALSSLFKVQELSRGQIWRIAR